MHGHPKVEPDPYRTRFSRFARQTCRIVLEEGVDQTFEHSTRQAAIADILEAIALCELVGDSIAVCHLQMAADTIQARSLTDMLKVSHTRAPNR